jgi:hypothetical protein
MTKFGLLCTAALLVGASSAHALNLGMPGFAGYSVLSNPCPLCDSLVNFTVYQNVDGDWTDDPYFANVSQNGMADSDGQWGTSIDSSAGYVYMYQPVNLDNNNPPDNPLVSFGVTMHANRLANVTSAGYFGGVFLGEIGQTVDANPHFDVDDIDLMTYVPDIAGDRTPNRANEGTVGLTPTATQIVAPTSVFSGNLISNAGAGFGPTPGITFLYGGTIPTNVSSTTVFLTSNQRPGYEWSETESIGGSGAVGDVPAPIPVPAGAVLLGSGIAIAGLYRRFASPKTAV